LVIKRITKFNYIEPWSNPTQTNITRTQRLQILLGLWRWQATRARAPSAITSSLNPIHLLHLIGVSGLKNWKYLFQILIHQCRYGNSKYSAAFREHEVETHGVANPICAIWDAWFRYLPILAVWSDVFGIWKFSLHVRVCNVFGNSQNFISDVVWVNSCLAEILNLCSFKSWISNHKQSNRLTSKLLLLPIKAPATTRPRRSSTLFMSRNLGFFIAVFLFLNLLFKCTPGKNWTSVALLPY